MTAMDVRYWSFFGLGLLSLMLLMGALAVWWQARVLQRSQHAPFTGARDDDVFEAVAREGPPDFAGAAGRDRGARRGGASGVSSSVLPPLQRDIHGSRAASRGGARVVGSAERRLLPQRAPAANRSR